MNTRGHPLSVLLTGGNGFVGRFLIDELRRRSHRVIALARPGSTVPGCDRVEPVDLAAPLDPDRVPQVDVVVHLAQSPHHRDFPARALDVFQINTAATLSLVEGARRRGAAQFLFASTGGVCGFELPQEGRPGTPIGFYPATKVAAEALLVPYAAYLSICTLRLFTPYGPTQQNRLIPALVDRVKRGDAITLDGAGEGLQFSAVHVHDLAALIADAIEQRWAGPFSVAAPRPTSIRQVGECLGRLLRTPVTFKHSGLPEPAPLVADTASLSAVYDVERLRSIEAGLEQLVSA